MSEFGQLLLRLVPRYGGTKQDLARAISVTPSAFSRLLGGAPPDVEVCLRLALATGTSPSQILHAAGLSPIDALLHSLYGPAAKSTKARREGLTPLERRRLQQWRALTPAEDRALSLILSHVSAAPATTRRRKTA